MSMGSFWLTFVWPGEVEKEYWALFRGNKDKSRDNKGSHGRWV